MEQFQKRHRTQQRLLTRPYSWAKTWVLYLSLVAGLGLGLSPNPVFAESNPGQILAIGNTGEPETLDPHRYNLRLEETLLNDLFLGLTTFDAKGNIVPGAAHSWDTSKDGLTWTFYLREDLRWSDGVALNADDFVYAFRRLQNPTTAASLAYFMHMLKNAEAVNSAKLPVDALGVEAKDTHTLVLQLERPYPFLLERLLYPTAYPVPKHAIEQFGDDWIKPEHWVSNGAYTLKSWRPQDHIALQANPKFIEPATISQVKYYPVSNEQSAYNRYRNGELDVIGSFPVGELSKVKANLPDELLISDLLSMFYLVFNTTLPGLDDVRVRQALSLAIDQTILADKVMRSGNAAAFSFAPQIISNYLPAELPHKNISFGERQKQARKLLAAAGYGPNNKLKLTLRHVTAIEIKKISLAITGMWKAIGVDAVLQQSEIRNHFAALRQAEFDVGWAGWVGENNAEHYLTLLQSDIGNVNYGRFGNDEYDRLIQIAKDQPNQKLRHEALYAAEAHMVNFYPVVPLYTNAIRRLVNPQLQGWHTNPRDIHQSRYLKWQD